MRFLSEELSTPQASTLQSAARAGLGRDGVGVTRRE